MRCLRPSGRRRCPLLGGDTAAFCASLVEGMAHLESTLEVDNGVGGGAGVGSGSVSMRWCADAMRLVKRMQREMLAIFRKADVPELEPWRESLSLIHDRFPSRATVAEHEKVATVVRDLVNGKDDGGGRHGSHQQDELARGHVELLRARSGELREEVEMFDCVLDEVFDEVIRGRNEMLGILRDKALT